MKKGKIYFVFVLFILIISSIIVYKSRIFKDDIYVVSKKIYLMKNTCCRD